MKPSIIAISGKSGCGNTTVSSLVARLLGRRFINYTFRALAAERNLELDEVLRLAENDSSWDRLLDARQVELARQGDCVIGSRLAIWLLPDAALRIYLKAGQEARVRRIHSREGGEIEAIAKFTAERDARDHGRYLETYGIDNDDVSKAHIMIDTERWEAPQIARIIVNAFMERENP